MSKQQATDKMEIFRANMNAADVTFIQTAKKLNLYPVVTRDDLKRIAAAANTKAHPYWICNSPKNRVKEATYYLPDEKGFIDRSEIERLRSTNPASDPLAVFEATADELATPRMSEFVPSVDSGYVGWGKNYAKVQRFITDRSKFLTVFITGLSGNGKTTMVEQLCARNNREYVRCNITELTDEGDLIGEFRLENGNTVFHKGPATIAAERGAVLLIDEIDLASQKLMCLQPVLEGKPFFIKKINKWITPAKGFMVIATANTKGLGDETATFIGTNFLNEAMLDRFSYTYEQEYPPKSVENRILSLVFAAEGVEPDNDIITSLCDWAADNRKTHADGGFDKVITTRRMVNIVKHYMMFGDILEAIRDCVARFDDASRNALIALYEKYMPKAGIPNIGAVDDDEKYRNADGIWYKDDADAATIMRKNNIPQSVIEKIPTDLNI